VATSPRDRCAVARTLDLVGERWTFLVLREAFLGVRRFDDLLAGVGCARNLLASRLGTLVDAQVLTKVPYQEAGQRERFEYRLTDRGRALFPILVALMDWGDQWLVDGPGPVDLRHRACGAHVRAELVCADGHGPLTVRDTEPKERVLAAPPRPAKRAHAKSKVVPPRRASAR
jgi:DNA-binding HxlR family transcriptional regulator